MLDQEKIAEYFALVTGLDGDALTRWQCLCDNAAKALAARVRVDVDVAAEMEPLCAAAAAMAYADYLALQNSTGGTDELKVGDITLRGASASGGAAEDVMGRFLARAAHLLEPDCPALILAGGNA